MTNLDIRSNLVVDNEKYRPVSRFMPGDYVAKVYPEKVDARVINNELTQSQIIEYEQYLVCSLCGRTCAGNCLANS